MAAARPAAAIPSDPHPPMNDHHFSYPVVVPLRGATISGHAAPTASLHAAGLMQPPVRPPVVATPAGKPASVAA
jgi:hypothetical protein